MKLSDYLTPEEALANGKERIKRRSDLGMAHAEAMMMACYARELEAELDEARAALRDAGCVRVSLVLEVPDACREPSTYQAIENAIAPVLPIKGGAR